MNMLQLCAAQDSQSPDINPYSAAGVVVLGVARHDSSS